MRLFAHILLVSLFLAAAGCSNTRFLAEDQLLYTGRKGVHILGEQEEISSSAVKQLMRKGNFQRPNNSVFDRRILPPVGLWINNYWQDDEQKKIRHWIYRTASKPPVLVSDIQPEIRARTMANDLFDQGYFNARAWPVVDTSERNPRKARVAYFVVPGKPYRYAGIHFDSSLVKIDTFNFRKEFRGQIRSGDQYNLDKLKKARNDLSGEFQKRGYFYFNQDHIQLEADTALGNNEMDLAVGVDDDLQPAVLSTFGIDSIQIYITRSSDTTGTILQSSTYDDFTVFSSGDYLELKVLRKALFIKTGDEYSYSAYQNTITRLNNLGVFSYVRITYEDPGQDDPGNLLDVRIDLIMADQINLSLEADMVMKSTGFLGPGVSATFAHNNTFKGAEKIQISPSGAVEWQWGPRQESQLGTFSYEMGVNSSLTFPSLLLPGRHTGLNHIVDQETSVNLNFNILSRTKYYRMFSTLSSYKLSWGKRKELRQSFSPVYLNSVSLLATTPAFDSVINDNIYIRKSFEEQFIIGMKYDFSYDNTYKQQPHQIFFQAGISSSGNLLDLVDGIGKESSDRPYRIFNTVYSQHFKVTTDFRYYINGYNMALATRLFAGIGIPYRNSTVLPYVEQFFSGGAYSIRGFTARTLGPGSYHEVESSYIDQSGDMKLEANLEFRFGITKIIKGALFLETGNIWLINEDEDRPGSQFNIHTFYNQLAVGTGVGLRFDFNFFVLRTDLGFPLRTPYLQDDQNWLPGNGSLFSGGLFYIAIGYPF